MILLLLSLRSVNEPLNIQIWSYSLYYHLQMKLWEGNVLHLSVSHIVHGRGCVSQNAMGQTAGWCGPKHAMGQAVGGVYASLQWGRQGWCVSQHAIGQGGVKRAVRILLECILVFYFNYHQMANARLHLPVDHGEYCCSGILFTE